MTKELGQYFTVNEVLQKHVYDLVVHKDKKLLEPSFGSGHLLRSFKTLNEDYEMDCYEIDSSIVPCVSFNDNQKVKYCNFLEETIDEKYFTIIGNPPYVKTSTINLYLQFIDKCFNLLQPGGELIFIVPSDFIKLTSASSIISRMCEVGSFTDFIYPHDEKLFNEASIDVVVFRYEYGLCTKKVNVNGIEKYCLNNKGLIIFSDTEHNSNTFGDYFDIYVGLVSGKDEVYKVPFGNIDILVDEQRIDKFIFTKTFPSGDNKIDEHLINNKDKLLSRRIKKFGENNWYEWGAPRNMKSIESQIGNKCIYVKNLTRDKKICFVDTVQYFGGKLICMIPKVDIDLNKVVSYMNSETFKTNYMYSGRFKIGHRQISLANYS